MNLRKLPMITEFAECNFFMWTRTWNKEATAPIYKTKVTRVKPKKEYLRELLQRTGSLFENTFVFFCIYSCGWNTEWLPKTIKNSIQKKLNNRKNITKRTQKISHLPIDQSGLISIVVFFCYTSNLEEKPMWKDFFYKFKQQLVWAIHLFWKVLW